MSFPDILASVGVIILLIAFLLNLYRKISAKDKIYAVMNFIGAGICCYSSYLIKFYPFVLLEAVWSIVALLSLFNVPRGTSGSD